MSEPKVPIVFYLDPGIPNPPTPRVSQAFPIQVDGDDIGAHAELDLTIDPWGAHGRCLSDDCLFCSRIIAGDTPAEIVFSDHLARVPRHQAGVPRTHPAGPP